MRTRGPTQLPTSLPPCARAPVQADSTCSGLNSFPHHNPCMPGPQCQCKKTAPVVALTVAHVITTMYQVPSADRQHMQRLKQLSTLLHPCPRAPVQAQSTCHGLNKFARAPLQADSTSSSITVAQALTLVCHGPVQADSTGNSLNSCHVIAPMCQGPSAGTQHQQWPKQLSMSLPLCSRALVLADSTCRCQNRFLLYNKRPKANQLSAIQFFSASNTNIDRT
jgi:hypothetical protein